MLEEHRGLVVKTVAMVERVRQALEPIGVRVALALIDGAATRGTDTAAGDIDLLVVADGMSLEEFYSAITRVQTALERRIDSSVVETRSGPSAMESGIPATH